MIWIFSYSLLFPLLFNFAVIGQIAPFMLCLPPRFLPFRFLARPGKLLAIDLLKFSINPVLHTNNAWFLPWRERLNSPHTYQFPVLPTVESSDTIACSAATRPASDHLPLRVKYGL